MEMRKIYVINLDKPEICDISNVMEKFGKYQVMQFFWICLPFIFVNMIYVNYVFTAGDLNYRCRIPECDGSNSTFEVGWWPNASIDRCSKPLLKEDFTPGSTCTNESFSGLLVECTEWVYESNNTVIAELNLGCRPWHSNLIGTIHNLGSVISILIAGWVSDRIGRKPTMIFCVVCGCIGQLKTLATSYYVYLTLEFLEAVLAGGGCAAAVVLMLEICGTQDRMMSGVVFAFTLYFGDCLFAVIAMFVPYWKTLIHIINSPCILFISLVFLIRESPRWQVLCGKTENAKKNILLVAEMNKVNIDREELSELDEHKLKNKFNIEAETTIEGLREILASKEILKRVLVTCVFRFTCDFVYFGMMINSVFLPGNKYINFLLSTVMSFPGELISLYVMNKFGRKMPLLIGFLVCGAFGFGTGTVPEKYTWAKIIVYMVGKMLISICYTGGITYTMELYPTSARGFLIGVSIFASSLGGILAPLTPILNPISPALPPILFGCSALLSGLLLILTPETKDLPLMDTIRQVEESVRARKDVKTTHGCENPGQDIAHNNEST